MICQSLLNVNLWLKSWILELNVKIKTKRQNSCYCCYEVNQFLCTWTQRKRDPVHQLRFSATWGLFASSANRCELESGLWSLWNPLKSCHCGLIEKSITKVNSVLRWTLSVIVLIFCCHRILNLLKIPFNTQIVLLVCMVILFICLWACVCVCVREFTQWRWCVWSVVP